jgi:two-component system OmpR family sensor kinase
VNLAHRLGKVRPPKRRLSLRTRILLAFLGVVVVTLVINLVSISLVHGSLYTQVDEVLSVDATAIMQSSSATAPTSHSTENLTTQLQTFASSIGVVAVKYPTSTTSEVTGQPAGVSLLAANGPLPLGNVTLGSWRFVTVTSSSGTTVTVGENLDTYSATTTAVNLEELLSTVITITLLIILSIWTIVNGVRPLAAITSVVREIDSGNLNERIDVTDRIQGTEYAAVGSSFNAMLDGLAEHSAREFAISAELRQFVADAGHELRTPLTVISGYTQILARGTADPVRTADSLARIDSEVSRMSRVVDDLLSLAKLETRSELRYESVNLADMVSDLVEDHRAVDTDSAHPVEVVVHGLVTIDADVDLLSRVFVNLLANLRAHTPEGTAATIELRTVDQVALATYSDNGPGVSDPSQVFIRFWQANTNRSGTGTGLGMAIAAAAVRAHHGDISAENSPTGGFTVRVRLPLVLAVV